MCGSMGLPITVSIYFLLLMLSLPHNFTVEISAQRSGMVVGGYQGK